MTVSRSGRLLNDTLLAASGRVATVGLWVVLTPALLRALGTERFGLWALFLAVAGYFGGFDLGLSQSVLRHVAAARARGDVGEAAAHTLLGVAGYLLLGVTWWLVLALCGSWIVGLLRIPPEHIEDGLRLVRASPALFAAIGIAGVATASLQGHGRFDLAGATLLSGVAVQGAGVLWVIRHGAEFAPLILAVIAGWVVAALIGFTVVSRVVPGALAAPIGSLRSHASDSLRFGLPMQWATACATIHQQMDKFFIARFVSLAAVTPFEIGFRVAAAAATVPQQFFLAVMPMMAELRTGRHEAALARLYRRGDRLVLAATSLWLAALVAAAGPLLQAWLGTAPPGAAALTALLAISWAVALSTGMGTSLARGISRTSLEARFASVVLAVHLVLSLILIPRMGAIGAGIATVVANTVGACVFLVEVARTMEWRWQETALEGRVVPVIASVLGAVAGIALARAWPASEGLTAWLRALGIASAAATIAAIALAVGGYARALQPQAADGPGAGA